MKYLTIITCFCTIAFACQSVSAQQINFNRYASAWVQTKDSRPDLEQNSINTNSELSDISSPGVTLYIPSKSNVSMPNGNRFIKAYLINNTNDSVKIKRIDATIDDVETEIKVGNNWKLFQRNIRSSCGNSYFTKNLDPQSYLSIEMPDVTTGPYAVSYRIVIKIGDQKIISNEAIVHVSKELLDLAGTPIKDLAL